MNLYATLDDLKELLDIAGAEDNKQLMRILEGASRQIEKPKLAGRWFYCWEGTRYYDGKGSNFWLTDDLLSITTLKCDEDGDGTYEATLAATDYFLYPLTAYPKIKLQINSNGDYAAFAQGISKGIEIDGVFGYADSATPYEAKTAIDEAGDINTSVTQFTVDEGKEIKIGQTIRVDNEQMFVEDVVNNELYVRRGVNGTTATIHTDGSDVYVYKYPEDITQAVLILAMRAWKRKDSAFQDVVGIPETGRIITSKGIDPDVLELVSPFRKQEYI